MDRDGVNQTIKGLSYFASAGPPSLQITVPYATYVQFISAPAVTRKLTRPGEMCTVVRARRDTGKKYVADRDRCNFGGFDLRRCRRLPLSSENAFGKCVQSLFEALEKNSFDP